MKKFIIVVTAIILAILIGLWLYLAEEFEKKAYGEFLPLIEQYKSKVVIKSVEVNKYSFNLILNEVELLSNSKTLSFYTDKIRICHIPHSRKITIKSIGKEGKLKDVGDILYAPNHEITLSISKPFLKRDSNDLAAHLKFNKFTIFDSTSEKELLSQDSYDFKFTNTEKNADTYLMETSAISKNVSRADVMLSFIQNKMVKATTTIDDKELVEILTKLFDVIGPLNGDAKTVLEYPKPLLSDFIKWVQQPNANDFMVLALKLPTTNFALQILSHESNKFLDRTVNANIINNNDIAKINFSYAATDSFTEEQKAQLIEILGEYFAYQANNFKQDKATKDAKKFYAADFREATSPFLNFRNQAININLNYNKADNSFTHELQSKLDDYSFEANGLYKNFTYSGELKFSDPAKLIQNTANYVDNAILPIIKKAEEPEIAMAEFLKITTSNIREHGLKAMTALSKDDNEIKPGSSITIPVDYSMSDGASLDKIKINKKTLNELPIDERIKLFLQSFEQQNSN